MGEVVVDFLPGGERPGVWSDAAAAAVSVMKEGWGGTGEGMKS